MEKDLINESANIESVRNALTAVQEAVAEKHGMTADELKATGEYGCLNLLDLPEAIADIPNGSLEVTATAEAYSADEVDVDVEVNNNRLDFKFYIPKGEKGDSVSGGIPIFVYALSTGSDIAPAAPVGGSLDINTYTLVGDNVVNGSLNVGGYVWSQDIPAPDNINKFIWQSNATFDFEGKRIIDWSTPICLTGADGRDGVDGTSIEFIYRLIKDKDLVDDFVAWQYSETLESANEVDFVPTTTDETYSDQPWTREPSGIGWHLNTEEVNTLYEAEVICSRTLNVEKDNDGNVISSTWGPWSTPTRWAMWGEDGMDGPGIEYIFLNTPRDFLQDPEDSESSAELNASDVIDRYLPKLKEIREAYDALTDKSYESINKMFNDLNIQFNEQKTENDVTWDLENWNKYDYIPAPWAAKLDDFVEGWKDNPDEPTELKPKVWVLIRKGVVNDETNETTWGWFGDPKLWSRLAIDGKDGISTCHLELTDDQVVVPLEGNVVDADFKDDVTTQMILYLGSEEIPTELGEVTYSIDRTDVATCDPSTGVVTIANNQLANVEWIKCIATYKEVEYSALFHIYKTASAYELKINKKIVERDPESGLIANHCFPIILTGRKWIKDHWENASRRIEMVYSHLDGSIDEPEYIDLVDGVYEFTDINNQWLRDESSLTSISFRLEGTDIYENLGVIANGKDGAYREYLYCRSKEFEGIGDRPTLTAPDGWQNADSNYQKPEWGTNTNSPQTIDTTAYPNWEGWADDPWDVGADGYDYIYVSSRNTSNGIWQEFSYPTLYAMKGKPGDPSITTRLGVINTNKLLNDNAVIGPFQFETPLYVFEGSNQITPTDIEIESVLKNGVALSGPDASNLVSLNIATQYGTPSTLIFDINPVNEEQVIQVNLLVEVNGALYPESFTINILRTGGENACHLELDNDNETVVVNESDNTCSATTTASFYVGTSDFSSVVESTYESYNCTVEKNGHTYTVTEMTGDEADVVITVEYKSVKYSRHFTIKRAKFGESYKLIVTPLILNSDKLEDVTIQVIKVTSTPGNGEVLDSLGSDIRLLFNGNDISSSYSNKKCIISSSDLDGNSDVITLDVRHADGTWVTYDSEVLGYFNDGVDGVSAFKSTVFIRSNETVTVPSGGSYGSPWPTTDGWSDGIPDGDAQLWASTRIFTSNGEAPQQSEWTTPTKMSDTTDFDVAYHKGEIPEGKPLYHHQINQGNGWSNEADGAIWMATSTKRNGSWGEWLISKIKGETGNDAVTYNIYPNEGWIVRQRDTSGNDVITDPKDSDGNLINIYPIVTVTTGNNDPVRYEGVAPIGFVLKYSIANGNYETYTTPISPNDITGKLKFYLFAESGQEICRTEVDVITALAGRTEGGNASLIYRGKFDPSTTYYGTDERIDIVCVYESDGSKTYYKAVQGIGSFTGSNSTFPETEASPTEYWSRFTEQIESIATEQFFADGAVIGGWTLSNGTLFAAKNYPDAATIAEDGEIERIIELNPGQVFTANGVWIKTGDPSININGSGSIKIGDLLKMTPNNITFYKSNDTSSVSFNDDENIALLISGKKIDDIDGVKPTGAPSITSITAGDSTGDNTNDLEIEFSQGKANKTVTVSTDFIIRDGKVGEITADCRFGIASPRNSISNSISSDVTYEFNIYDSEGVLYYNYEGNSFQGSWDHYVGDNDAETNINGLSTTLNSGEYIIKLVANYNFTTSSNITPILMANLRAEISATLKEYEFREVPDSTVLATNGLRSAWGDAYMYFDNSGFTVGKGAYALKVGNDGIMQSSDRTLSWSKLTSKIASTEEAGSIKAGNESSSTNNRRPLMVTKSGEGYIEIPDNIGGSTYTPGEGIVIDDNSTITLAKASADALGGVKTGYGESGNNYAIKTDDDGRAYVTVSDTVYSPGLGIVINDKVIDNTGVTAIKSDTNGHIQVKQANSDDWSDITVYEFSGTIPTTYLTGGLVSGNTLYLTNQKNETVITFTPTTTYSLPNASTTRKGGVIIGSNITVSNGTISLTKDNITDALGYTPPTANTTYSNATTSTSGLMSSSDKSKLDNITASADSVSFTRNLSSGTKIGTITINGTETNLYCNESNTVSYSNTISGGIELGKLIINGSTNSIYMPSASSLGIPTVYDSTITIKANGNSGSFTLNSSSGKTIDLGGTITSSTAVGSPSEPVYFSGGIPIKCDSINAASASKLSKNGGSESKPVYFSEGVPKAITSLNIGTGSITCGQITASGNITSTADVIAYQTSDVRLKDNVETIDSKEAADVINALRPVTFEWNETATSLSPERKGVGSGFIAQEFEEVIPNASRPIWGEYKSIDYIRTIPYMVSVIQDLTKQVSELKDEIKKLKEV